MIQRAIYHLPPFLLRLRLGIFSFSYPRTCFSVRLSIDIRKPDLKYCISFIYIFVHNFLFDVIYFLFSFRRDVLSVLFKVIVHTYIDLFSSEPDYLQNRRVALPLTTLKISFCFVTSSFSALN